VCVCVFVYTLATACPVRYPPRFPGGIDRRAASTACSQKQKVCVCVGWSRHVPRYTRQEPHNICVCVCSVLCAVCCVLYAACCVCASASVSASASVCVSALFPCMCPCRYMCVRSVLVYMRAHAHVSLYKPKANVRACTFAGCMCRFRATHLTSPFECFQTVIESSFQGITDKRTWDRYGRLTPQYQVCIRF
jgi:hypothetical protein